MFPCSLPVIPLIRDRPANTESVQARFPEDKVSHHYASNLYQFDIDTVH